MNRGTFAVLALIALLLAGLAIMTERGGDTVSIAGSSAGELLLPDLAERLGDIASITINGAGDEPLVRVERSGTEWVVAEQDGYPAAAGKVNGLLIALGEARIVEEKTADPNFHSRLGVEAIESPEATGLEVELTAAEGESFALILGDAYGEGERYARASASAQSVLIDRNPEIAREPADWVQPEILAIPANRVQRVEITHADGERLVIRKEAPELTDFQVESLPAGRELQYAGIANVTGSVLQSLNLEAVSRPPDSPGELLSSTEFRTFDGLVITVTATTAEEADGEPWLSFAARFDAAQAATDSDASAEAAALNERLAGWRYRIPAYQYSQMTRHMEDLLRAPPSE
jgi:hypothetical protein